MNQEVEIPCEECAQGGGTARIGQSLVSDELRWYRSILCRDGRHIEEDDIGFPPLRVREELLKWGGRWNLVITGTNKAEALLVIRRALGLSIKETASRLRSFPVVFTGTKTEAAWLKGRMESSNIASQIIEYVAGRR